VIDNGQTMVQMRDSERVIGPRIWNINGIEGLLENWLFNGVNPEI
jgi:hypothetical protein